MVSFKLYSQNSEDKRCTELDDKYFWRNNRSSMESRFVTNDPSNWKKWTEIVRSMTIGRGKLLFRSFKYWMRARLQPHQQFRAPHPWKMLRFVNKKAPFRGTQEIFKNALTTNNWLSEHLFTQNRNQLYKSSFMKYLTQLVAFLWPHTDNSLSPTVLFHRSINDPWPDGQDKRRKRNDLSAAGVELKADSSCHVGCAE